MKLHYKTFGEGFPMIILHGLFGSGDNWVSISKRFSEYYKVIVVDQRNHGHSPWSDEMNYDHLSQDLKELCDDLKIDKAIVLGHSMGGKTALKFNNSFPGLITKMIIVDMGIKKYPPHHTNIIQAIDSVDLNKISSRREVEQILISGIDSVGVRQFIMKNLYWKDKGKLSWRMNFQVLKQQMSNILEELSLHRSNTHSLFIKGEHSNYILDEDVEFIESFIPDSTFVTIEGAGHWVHAEKTEDFTDEVLSFCLL